MLTGIIASIVVGIALGAFTGLVPGIHINLVGAILISLSLKYSFSLSGIYLVTIISAMAITHIFVDFIPSIFLGCPDTETELSILPGHEMLKQGRGYEAIALALYGGLVGTIVLILISFPSIVFISKINSLIQKGIPYILIFASGFLIFLEKRRFSALIAFILSGFLGMCVFSLELKEPLLPLLTGLFGSSMIITSIRKNVEIPPQEITSPKIKSSRPIFGAMIASLLCGFLPGLGSGQAAILGTALSRIKRKSQSFSESQEKKEFLFLLGATNILVMGFSFLSLYAISKTRTGAAAAIQEITGELNLSLLLLILGVILVSGVISFFISKELARYFSNRIAKINYAFISKIVLIFLCLMILFFSGIEGFFVFIISTLTGIYCISLKIKRTHMMGCLLLPTIIFYLF